MEPVDFYISMTPVAIKLECPYCEWEIDIPWDEIDGPDYWGDDWGEVTCPHCNKAIKLGDYECD